MQHVVVIGEDVDRMQPLLHAIAGRGAHVTVWDTGVSGALDLTAPPDGTAVYFCRQSPSAAAARGRRSAVPYTRQLLQWLARHGVPVVNGVSVLDTETSKAAQMDVLAAAGVRVPVTYLAHGVAQARLMAKTHFPDKPVIIKPNCGGSGKGVAAYGTGALAAVEFAGTDAPDNLWVVQEHVGVYSDDVTQFKSIIRAEVVGGRVQRDYFVQITAPSSEFSLCPCDLRFERVLSSISFKIVRNVHTIPGLESVAALDGFCGKIEAAFAAVGGAAVGAVEAMVVAGQEPVVFDMNFNTNYNATAEAAAGIQPGADRVAEFLLGLVPVPVEGPSHK
jgi:hypothetical protein